MRTRTVAGSVVLALLVLAGCSGDDDLAAMDELASLALGDNWAVQTVLRETAEQIAAAIGGEVVSPAS